MSTPLGGRLLAAGPSGARLWALSPQRPRGPALLLLPGIEGAAATFCAQAPLGRRVDLLAVDLPALDDLDAAAAAIAALLPPRRLLLVGASFGALVARSLARQPGLQAIGLVGVGALPAPRFVPAGLRRGHQALGHCPDVAFRLLYRRRIAARLREEGVCPERARRHLDALPDRQSLRARLQALLRWTDPPAPQLPTTWLRGQVDREAPWTLAQAAEALPGAAVETVPGGHRPWLTHPQQLHDILEALLVGPVLAQGRGAGA